MLITWVSESIRLTHQPMVGHVEFKVFWLAYKWIGLDWPI